MNDATVLAPAAGMVTQKLVDQGELIAPRTPIVVVADLDHVWANVYVDEPLVPRVTLGQTATVFTDAGGPGIEGTVTFISPKAEFTPRNVQTAEERSKLVFRVKVTVDNRSGRAEAGDAGGGGDSLRQVGQGTRPAAPKPAARPVAEAGTRGRRAGRT